MTLPVGTRVVSVYRISTGSTWRDATATVIGGRTTPLGEVVRWDVGGDTKEVYRCYLLVLRCPNGRKPVRARRGRR